MGRKRDLTQTIKPGPGRKTKKQQPPTFPGLFNEGTVRSCVFYIYTLNFHELGLLYNAAPDWRHISNE